MRRWLILLGAALAVLFNRVLTGEVFYWGLPSLQFVPWRWYALEQLRDGVIPLWNPLNGAGAPLFANYQSALLYPFSWLSYFAPGADMLAWLMTVTAILHLVVAAWGMWTLTRRLGFSEFGAAVSAFAFALSGYLVARLGTFPMISAAAWLPWVLVGIHGVLEHGRFRDAGWLAFFAAMLLTAGHAQMAWYTLLLGLFFTVWWIVRFRLFGAPGNLLRIVQQSAVRGIGVLAAILLGAGVATFQLAATAELLGESGRSDGAEYSFAVNFSYAPARILNLINPNVFGTPADGSYLTEGAYFEDAVYIGLIPLISAVAAVLAWVRGKRNTGAPGMWSAVPFAFLVSGIGFVLALGRYSPVFPFLYDHVPTFDLFQAPVRWHLWTVFGLSLLAGVGVQAWGRDRRTRRFSRWGLTAGVSAVLAITFGFLALETPSDGVAVLMRAVFATGVVGALASFLSLRQPETGTGAHWRWSGVVLVVVLVDLVWANWGLNPTTAASFYTADDPDHAGRTYWSAEVEDRVRYDEVFRFDDYTAAASYPVEVLREIPNANILSREASLNNFEPLRIAAYLDYVAMIDSTPLEQRDRLLAMAGVTIVRDVETGGETRTVGESESAARARRAYVVGYDAVCWQTSTDAVLDAMRTGETGAPNARLNRAYLLGDGDCPPAPEDGSSGTARVIEDIGNRVTLDVRADRLSWVVLADTMYPGWRAYVDGLPVPLYDANGTFRAVQVDDGRYTVTFAYGPSWLLTGLFLSIICTLLMVVLIRVRETGTQPE